MFSPLEHSIVGKAREKGLFWISSIIIFEKMLKRPHVDDEPYGGGQGMLSEPNPFSIPLMLLKEKSARHSPRSSWKAV